MTEPLEPTETARPPLERPALDPKERMTIEPGRMPEQDATARATNFGEVNLGLTEQMAILEAERCLQCKKPDVHRGLPGARSTSRGSSTSWREGDMRGRRRVARSTTTRCRA